MNIFQTHKTAKRSAEWLCDKLVNKMMVESCQLLATCFDLSRLSAPDCPRTQSGTPRKWFNPKHPSALWTRYSRANMNWLIEHTFYIEEERIKRGYKPHFSKTFLNWVCDNIQDSFVEDGDFCDVFVAINDKQKCRQIKDFDNLPTITKYRLYIKNDKPFATWKVNRPFWMDLNNKEIIVYDYYSKTKLL